MNKKALKVTALLLCVIAVSAALLFAVTESRLFEGYRRNSYIRKLCREHSISLHLASVSETENGDHGLELFFSSDGGISDSSVTSAIALYDLIGSDECGDSFLRDKPVKISVYAVDTPNGGFTISGGAAKKIDSFYGSIKDMFGIGVLEPIKADLEYVSIMDARNIKTDDFKDFTSLKNLELIDCKDETGKNTYGKKDKGDFVFHDDSVGFEIMNTY